VKTAQFSGEMGGGKREAVSKKKGGGRVQSHEGKRSDFCLGQLLLEVLYPEVAKKSSSRGERVYGQRKGRGGDW